MWGTARIWCISGGIVRALATLTSPSLGTRSRGTSRCVVVGSLTPAPCTSSHVLGAMQNPEAWLLEPGCVWWTTARGVLGLDSWSGTHKVPFAMLSWHHK